MTTQWTIDTAQTTAYLQALVRINSVNPDLAANGPGESAVANWLVETCRALGLEVRLQETAPNRPNVIARWAGTGAGKSILLTGHMDVVSVENMQGDPFDARIEDGKLYGRGSYDMKGGLASILGAVAALKSGGFQPAGDIWLGFVTDEEYLSIGTDALVKELHPDAAILTEPTGSEICIAHKGFAWLTITTEGFAAHGSQYETGIDAIAHMGRILRELERMERDFMPQSEHPLLGRPSVHASLISGGLGLSTYPDLCTLRVEHRLLPDESPDDLLTLWNSVLEYVGTDDHIFKAAVRLDAERPGYEIDQQAPIVQTLETAYNAVTGRSPEFVGQYGWLDSAILGGAGIPTVIIGPGGVGAHAAVEYVYLAEVHLCAGVIAEAVSQWAG